MGAIFSLDWPAPPLECIFTKSHFALLLFSMVASAGLVSAQEGPNSALKLAFTNTGLGGMLAKGPRLPETHLHLPLPASCLLGAVTESGTRLAWLDFQ